MKLILIAVLILSGLGLAVESHADAATEPPCVSQHEFASIHHPTYRDILEQRWGVIGQGVRVTPGPANPRLYVLKYRACGYSLAVASVQVTYNHRNLGIGGMRFKSVGIPAHGPT